MWQVTEICGFSRLRYETSYVKTDVRFICPTYLESFDTRTIEALIRQAPTHGYCCRSRWLVMPATHFRLGSSLSSSRKLPRLVCTFGPIKVKNVGNRDIEGGELIEDKRIGYLKRISKAQTNTQRPQWLWENQRIAIRTLLECITRGRYYEHKSAQVFLPSFNEPFLCTKLYETEYKAPKAVQVNGF